MLISPSLQDAAMVYKVFSEISREKNTSRIFFRKNKKAWQWLLNLNQIIFVKDTHVLWLFWLFFAKILYRVHDLEKAARNAVKIPKQKLL